MTALDASLRAVISRVYLNAGRELDAAHGDDLRTRILNAMDQSSESVMLLCSQVDFVDTGGLRILLEMERTAQHRGLRLRVMNPSQPLRDLLAFTGLADALDLDDASRHDDRTAPSTGSLIHGFPVADLPTRIQHSPSLPELHTTR